MFRIRTALIATSCLAASISLSGCSLPGISSSIDDLAGSSIQDALGAASSALDDANRSLAGAVDGLDEDMGELADTLRNLADVPDLLTSLFSDGELVNTSSHLEIIDAQTGDAVKTIDTESELSQIGDAIAGMDVASWRLISSTPDDAVAEYTLRFYSQPTKTLFDTEDSPSSSTSTEASDTAEALSITTYRDSTIVSMHVVLLDLTLDFELPQRDIDVLRGIA